MNAKKVIVKIFIWFVVTIATLLVLVVGSLFLFKDKIIESSFKEINKYLATKIDINEDIELSLFEKFPQVSLGFKDVKVYESIPGSSNLLGNAQALYITFDIWDILNKRYLISKLYIENGAFNLRVTKNGENNYTILKKDTTQQSKGNGDLALTDIYLKNVLVSYRNESNEQFYSVNSNELRASFSQHDGTSLIHLSGPQLIHTISVHNQHYFVKKEIEIDCDLKYDDLQKRFDVLKAKVLLDKSAFTVSGYYQYNQKNYIDLKIENEQSDIHTLLSLVPEQVSKPFAMYKSEGNVYFNATIKGILSDNQNAGIEVNFGCRNASFFHPDLAKKISDANFIGKFTNGSSHSAATSSLNLDNIRFDFDGKLIQGNFLYKNFENPFIEFDATGNIDASSLAGFYPSKLVKQASGTIDFDIAYKGLVDDLKSKEGHQRIEATGEVSLQNISILFTDAVQLSSATGTFLFNKNDVAITEFSTKLGNSDFAISGLIKNLFGAVFVENGRMYSDIKISSKYIDVEEITTLFSTTATTSPSADTSGDSKFPFLEKYPFVLDCEIATLKYKKVNMQNMKGNFRFDQPLMRVDNVSLGIAGGTLRMNGKADFVSSEKIETTIQTNLSRINIDSLLYMFDNFGQDFITSEHLKGELSGTIETAFYWNSQGKIDTKSIVASIDASILKGELNNFEPMNNLSKFIDANELAHIKFSEIKNKFFIENEKISFPEMQILSNVSDITISGTHSFDNEMDYKLAIPLKNLKRHKIDKDASFGAIEQDSRKGTTVFLSIKGVAPDYKISYDGKRAKSKLSDDLKKEKQEFKDLFKKKEQEVEQTVKPNKEEFFDF